MTRRRRRVRWSVILWVCLAPCGWIEAADGPTDAPPPGRLLERVYSTGIPLVADGASAVTIVYPTDSPGWKVLAERLAGAIESLGAASVPMVPDVEAMPTRLGPLRDDLQGKPLIVLGDLNTNRAFFAYYASYYTCCDARYPGETGYELRTVVRPFGWAANALLVGGSTQEGCAAGVDRLLERFRSLQGGQSVSLPYLLEVKLGDKVGGLFAPAIAELDNSGQNKPQCNDAVDAFTRNAHLYFYTGDERFARLARDAAVTAAECNYDQPGFPTGDYTMENLAAAWRRVSCSPAFSPADRVKIDAKMYETVAAQAKSWWRIAPEQGIGNRHQTTGGLAWWTLLRTMRELAAPDDAAAAQLEQWSAEASAYCDGLLRHYWDDEDDYQSADSAQNAASYAMQSGHLEWFESGLARRAAERLMMTVDNLGWYAGIQGYGDALPGWERFPLDAGLLMGACAFIYQDGAYNWVLDRFPMLEDSWGSLQPWGLHQFDTGGRLKQTQPDWMTGLQIARFTPYKLDRINSGEFLTTSIMDNFRPAGLHAQPVPPELAFDKLMYRGGTAETDPYLLFEGSAGTTLTTIDMNTIIRYGDAGKLWLVHNTGQRSIYFKNGVYISNGTNQQPMPPSCELTAHGDFAAAALAVSRLPDCRGMTWTRNLLIAKGRFIGVIDHLRAVEPGEYSLSCAWRTPGFAAMHGGRWEARQDDAMFCVLPGSLEGVTSDRRMQRDGATRPTTLRENRSLKAAPGSEVVFENVFYTTTDSRPRHYGIRRIAPGAVLVRDAADESVYLLAAGDRGILAGEFASDAAAVLLTSSEVFLAGGKSLSFSGVKVAVEAGATKLDAAQASQAKTILQSMWDAATEPVASPADSASIVQQATDGAPVQAWEHKGPATRGGLVDGVQFIKGRQVTGLSLLATDWIMPLLRAEPRLMGRQSSELVPVSRAQQAEHAPPAEPILKPLAGAEFTLELPVPTRVMDIDFLGETFGETADPLPAGTMSLELTFSSDGFKADKRVRRVDVSRRPTYHNLYKGHCYLFECYRVEHLNEEASAIRVHVLAGPADEGIITDVQIRAAGRQREEVEVRPIDLDGDGNDEVLAWTPEGDFVLLQPDGAEAWRKRFDAGVLAVDAWDLDGDGGLEVFVSHLDRQVDVFNRDGSPRWSSDFREAKKMTGGKYFGDGSVVYGMAAWRPETATEPKVLFTSYWYSTWLDTRGHVIDSFRRGGHFTQIREIPEGLPGAGGLAIRCDVPWPGSVPVQWWDVATGEPAGENQVPNGKSVYFELADYDGDGQVEALSASMQGIGLYSLREPKTRWEYMTDAPPVGVGVIPALPGRPATIVYGREDGYIFVMTAAGEVLAGTTLGEPLQSLTTAHTDEPIVWAGTRTSLLGLRLQDLAVAWREPGSYQTLTIQNRTNGERVLGVTTDGRLTALEMSRPR